MGALLRKAVGTLWGQAEGVRVGCRWDSGNLSLAWQPLGLVNSHRFGTEGRVSPGGSEMEGHTWFRGR